MICRTSATETSLKSSNTPTLRWKVRGIARPDPNGMFGNSWYELGVYPGHNEQDAIESCKRTIPAWQLVGLKLEADLIAGNDN